MRLRRIFGPLLFTAALSAQTATQPLQVVAIRFWSLADVTRVAIETNGDFRYNSDRIPNPDRLFFDLVDASPHLGAKGIVTKQVGDKFLKRVRIAQNVPGATRIVLDLEGDVEYTASQLGNPDRLMIELRRARTPAPVAMSAAISKLEPLRQVIPVIAPTLEVPGNATRPVAVLASDARLAMSLPRQVRMPVPVSSTLPAMAPATTRAIATSVVASPAVIVAPVANPARRLEADKANSLTRALGLKINRVVIDPGHGGHDQGTSGSKGLLEKDLVLDISLRLGKLITERMGSEVIFTRSDDTFIPLQERTEFANRKRADLFLSIHANSSPVAHVSGIETYYLNFTTSADAMDVATRENASSDKSVYELQDLVQTIARHDKIEESREFAASVQSSLQALEIKSSPTAKDRGIRKAPFLVLIGAQMPSILAEIGFLSNPHEESTLTQPEFRQKMAEALYKGLFKYSQTLSHFELSKSAAHPSGSSSGSTAAPRTGTSRTLDFEK